MANQGGTYGTTSGAIGVIGAILPKTEPLLGYFRTAWRPVG